MDKKARHLESTAQFHPKRLAMQHFSAVLGCVAWNTPAGLYAQPAAGEYLGASHL